MDVSVLSLAVGALAASGLMVFPLGRRILKWWVVGSVAVALFVIGLMFASEPDISG